MNNLGSNEDHSEEKLRKRAARRAGFKVHVGIFLLVDLLCWVIWYFVFRNDEAAGGSVLNAVLFLSIAWFIALVAHYFIVYKWNKTLVDRELATLKKEIARKENEREELKQDNNQSF